MFVCLFLSAKDTRSSVLGRAVKYIQQKKSRMRLEDFEIRNLLELGKYLTPVKRVLW